MVIRSVRGSTKDLDIIDKNILRHCPIQPDYPEGTGRDFACLPAYRFHKIIAYYSQVRVEKDAVKRTIFPTGCAALVFRCDLNNPGAFFVGTPSTPREAEYVTLGCDYFLVWFWPGMGYSFFPIPAIETIDQACPLNKINTAEAGKITESVLLAQSFQERVAIFERFMERHMALLPEIPNNLSSLIATACDRIHVLTNEEMESCLGYGERHIRRLFLKYVGISPVLFKRIRRHQNTLKAMKVLLDQDLAGLAAEQGYFDQSHLIREFKQFLGTTPTQFVREYIREGQRAVPFGGEPAKPVGAAAYSTTMRLPGKSDYRTIRPPAW